MTLTNIERETIALFNEQEDTATLYTYNQKLIKRFNKCYPAIGTIARELKMSRSTVKRAIDDLEQSGWLTHEARWREKGGKSSNLYTLTL